MKENENINEYMISATEVLYILSYLPQYTISRIPEGFIKFLKEYQISGYKPSFDLSFKIDKIEISEKTKALLAIVYRNYICSESERNEFDKILCENEKIYQMELRKKYNYNNIFNHNEIERKQQISEQLIEYKKPKWYKKIFQKILKLLK